jgi:hypothetical protein
VLDCAALSCTAPHHIWVLVKLAFQVLPVALVLRVAQDAVEFAFTLQSGQQRGSTAIFLQIKMTS